MLQQNVVSLRKELLMQYPVNQAVKSAGAVKTMNKNSCGAESQKESSDQTCAAAFSGGAGKNPHYKKIQKLKKQGLAFDEVVKKLKLSPLTVKMNWNDSDETST